MHAHGQADKQVDGQPCACTHIHINVNVCARMHVHTHTLTYIHTHMHTHMCTHNTELKFLKINAPETYI